MLRTLNAFLIVTLLVGTAWIGVTTPSASARPHDGLGLVILAALQR